MVIDNKTLAFLAAAIVSTGLLACNRAGEDQAANTQGSSTMNQDAPRQGYTGPSTPSTRDDQMNGPSSTSPSPGSSSPTPTPGTSNPNTPRGSSTPSNPSSSPGSSDTNNR